MNLPARGPDVVGAPASAPAVAEDVRRPPEAPQARVAGCRDRGCRREMRAKTPTATAAAVLGVLGAVRLALLVMGLTADAPPPECEADEADCLRLWTGCAAISPRAIVGDNAIGLRRADVRRAVEGRLRASGVGVADEWGRRLFIGVRVDGPEFHALAGFFDGEGGHLWERRASGEHGGDAVFVNDWLRRFLDEFRVSSNRCG